MKRITRIALVIIGLLMGLYGSLNDYELVTLTGALLFVVGLMLPVFIGSNNK